MDPTSRRSKPPPHPSGYPVIEDAPVHLAPAVDVRESVRRAREALLDDGRSRSWPLLPAVDGDPAASLQEIPSAPVVAASAPGPVPVSRREPCEEAPPSSGSGGVLYTLAFPVEERRSVLPGAPAEVAPASEDAPREVAPAGDEADDAPPRTLAFGGMPPRVASAPPSPPLPPPRAWEADAPPRTVAFEPGARPGEPQESVGPRTVAFEPDDPHVPLEAGPRTVAFEPAIAPPPRTVSFEPPIEAAPRTIAFERFEAVVARPSISIGTPPTPVARSPLPPAAPPEPPPSEPFPLPIPAPRARPPEPPIAAQSEARVDASASAAAEPIDEPPPVSLLPPSVIAPLHSVVPAPSIPPALAPLLEGPDPTGEREAIARDLSAIGALDERADRAVEREVGAKATLARARALRFRLTLLDAFEAEPARGVPAGVLPIDLAIEAALLVGLSDGAPFVRTVQGGAELPFVRALVTFLRAARPDLPKSVLRERGAASIARITIAGYRPAMDALARGAMEITLDGRVLALDAAAFVALAPAANAHRLGALGDLERSLALRTGSVAQALELAHRRRR
jgi:hypothetical protein